jgi:WD40 repeat protein
MGLAWHWQGQGLLSYSRDQTIKAWQPANPPANPQVQTAAASHWDCAATIEQTNRTDFATALAQHPQRRLLYSGSNAGQILIWEDER